MKSIVNVTNKISDFIAKLTRILVVPITLGFTFIVFFGVITRFILKTPFVSSMEFSRICFVWFCFLGSTLAYKKGEHIQFVFLMNKVPENVRKVMKIIIDIICLLFFFVLLFESIKLTKKVSMTLFPASGLSYSIMYGVFPISSVFFIIHGFDFFFTHLNDLISEKGGNK